MRYASGMAADPALSRSARKTAATREAIVDAAQALLDDGGPAALTIPAVSERADVAVQTIYNRVGGRDALLIAVAERALEANRVYMDQAYATPGTPLERIRQAALAYAQFAAERPQQFRLIANPPDEPQALERIAGRWGRDVEDDGPVHERHRGEILIPGDATGVRAVRPHRGTVGRRTWRT